MRAARFAFWLLLLTPAALPAQWRDSSVVVSLLPAASAAEPVPRADATGAEASYALDEATAERAGGGVWRGVRTGALIGAVAGAASWGIFELTDDHWDHSYDSMVFVFMAVSGMTVGALIGLITSL
jgi:hypothetical protein